FLPGTHRLQLDLFYLFDSGQRVLKRVQGVGRLLDTLVTRLQQQQTGECLGHTFGSFLKTEARRGESPPSSAILSRMTRAQHSMVRARRVNISRSAGW